MVRCQWLTAQGMARPQVIQLSELLYTELMRSHSILKPMCEYNTTWLPWVPDVFSVICVLNFRYGAYARRRNNLLDLIISDHKNLN